MAYLYIRYTNVTLTGDWHTFTQGWGAGGGSPIVTYYNGLHLSESGTAEFTASGNCFSTDGTNWFPYADLPAGFTFTSVYSSSWFSQISPWGVVDGGYAKLYYNGTQITRNDWATYWGLSFDDIVNATYLGDALTGNHNSPYPDYDVSGGTILDDADGSNPRLVIIVNYSITAPLSITSVSPNQGLTTGNETVHVYGTTFNAGTTVKFDSSSATDVTLIGSTHLTCKTPAHASATVDVTVTNLDASTDSLVNGFAYYSLDLTVTSVTPSESDIYGTVYGAGPGPRDVVVTGTNFKTGALVNFGNFAATNVVVVDSETITCTIPLGPSDLTTCTVTNIEIDPATNLYDFGTLDDAFDYLDLPPITVNVGGVSPDSGSVIGGGTVTITGTNFTAGATILFNGIPATNVTFVNSTTYTCTPPANPPGFATITLKFP